MTTEPTQPLCISWHLRDDADVYAYAVPSGVAVAVGVDHWQNVTLYLSPGKAAELRDALSVALGTQVAS